MSDDRTLNDDERDEIASGLADGELADAEAARWLADSAVVARRAEFEALAERIRVVSGPSEDEFDRMIVSALAAFDEREPSTSDSAEPGAVAPLRRPEPPAMDLEARRRHRRAWSVLSAAAVLLVVVAVAGLLVRKPSSDTETAAELSDLNVAAVTSAALQAESAARSSDATSQPLAGDGADVSNEAASAPASDFLPGFRYLGAGATIEELLARAAATQPSEQANLTTADGGQSAACTDRAVVASGRLEPAGIDVVIYLETDPDSGSVYVAFDRATCRELGRLAP